MAIKRSHFIFILILVIIVTGIYLLMRFNSNPDPATNKDQYSKYLKPWPLPEDWKNIQSYSQKYFAFQLYDQHDYSEDAALENPADYDVRFYLGVCQLLTGESFKSIKEFNLVIENNSIEFSMPSKYYKSLALLKLDRSRQAKEILREIDLPEAKSLLQDIN